VRFATRVRLAWRGRQLLANSSPPPSADPRGWPRERPRNRQSTSHGTCSEARRSPLSASMRAQRRRSAEVGSPEHETTISELAGDAAKAARSLSALHRELLAALLRLTRRVSTGPRAAALVRDRGLDSRRDTDASSRCEVPRLASDGDVEGTTRISLHSLGTLGMRGTES
jgi:hypothetical protein